MRLVITDDFLKSSIASALVIASVAAHLQRLKKQILMIQKGHLILKVAIVH